MQKWSYHMRLYDLGSFGRLGYLAARLAGRPFKDKRKIASGRRPASHVRAFILIKVDGSEGPVNLDCADVWVENPTSKRMFGLPRSFPTWDEPVIDLDGAGGQQ
ncbi:hypothetical protein ACCS54_19520 [Rhizobium johnstonii]|uniref:hypothetical protein n=1 Tax=Rhizobium johnstonii TaxID=3019933 RepID=UPI003F94DEEF